ncbi:hypothetical protein CGMCC3_g15126 [Colletotrichum fructicola]|nr:uncharacterized protein CGMCC3_g15126 [Colletotrichum fructicola]KAE9568764.1 hypothetical protein CGMCC3_g15126 [Colletotrichum fructicola]
MVRVSALLHAMFAGSTAAQFDMYCNHGTYESPALSCDNGQNVYCCAFPNWFTTDPGLAPGFPIHRQCTKSSGECAAKDSNGNRVKSKFGKDAVGFGACVGIPSDHIPGNLANVQQC